MLYLVDKPLADVAFRTARGDDDPMIVLIQEGVLLAPDLEAPTYAVAKDVDVRGVDLPPRIEPITYDRVMDLVLEHGVRTFV